MTENLAANPVDHFPPAVRLTPALKSLILSLQKRMDSAVYQEMMSSVCLLFKQTQKQLLATEPGTARAHILHQLIDTAIESVSHIPVSCQKACSACCHFEVQITQDEAALLAELVMQGHPVDIAQLEKQSRRQVQDLAWQEGVVPTNRCAFLNPENACGIYVARPAACRRHSVVSPAQLCSDLKATPTSRNIPIAEVILSAAMSLPEVEIGSLSRMLALKLNANEKARSA